MLYHLIGLDELALVAAMARLPAPLAPVFALLRSLPRRIARGWLR
jgi:hypothetical protein